MSIWKSKLHVFVDLFSLILEREIGYYSKPYLQLVAVEHTKGGTIFWNSWI